MGAPAPAPRFVVVGNPENRRVGFFQAALAAQGLAPAVVVPYVELALGARGLAPLARALDDARADGSRVVVRVESPGENWDVERALIARGAARVEAEPPPARGGPARVTRDAALALAYDRGRIRYPRQWYLGYLDLLEQLRAALATAGAVTWMNAPEDIAVMFDKRASADVFARAGVPVPPALDPIAGYDALREAMRARGVERVFVKLAHGSSASGVIAYGTTAGREQAFTSMERVPDGGASSRLYNSLRIRRYTRAEEIRELVDYVCAEGARVECWLPKAALGTRPFDLRVVTVAGRARQFVVRVGRSPMTNLHLGNARGDPADFLARIGEARWREARAVCERAAAAFPASLYAGVDLLLEPRFVRCAVLEINAFGDLLPGVLDQGEDTYAAEVRAACARAASTA